MRTVPNLIALLLVVAPFAACDKDKDDSSPGRDDTTTWDFQNTADKAALQTKLDSLDELSRSAQRGAVPQSQTRSASPSAFSLLQAYANGEVSAPVPAANCAGMTALFGFGQKAETRGNGFGLTDGESCGDAVREMKSFYSQSLDALSQQVQWLRTLSPGTDLCGMRVEEVAVEPAKAAVGFKLSPSSLPTGFTFDQQVFGAANDGSVGTLTSLQAACVAGADCGPAYSVVGRSEAVGFLAEKKLRTKNDFAFTMAFADPKHGGTQDVTTTMKSESEVTGLNDADLLKASEATTFELVGDPSAAPGAGAYKVTMSLNLEEIGEGRLLVSGSFLTNDSDQAPQTFRVEFQRSGGSCAVRTRIAEDQTDTTPGVAFDDTKLQGSWSSDCAAASLGNFSYGNYQETAEFKAGRLARTFTAYSDSECFPGKEAAIVTYAGKYQFGKELVDAHRYDKISEYGLDVQYDVMLVTLQDDAKVQWFNDKKICGKGDWAKGVTAKFPAGECYFDVGNEPLLNDQVMQHREEYTVVRPYENLVTIDLAQSSFYSGATMSTRSRVATGAVRTLKHK